MNEIRHHVTLKQSTIRTSILIQT